MRVGLQGFLNINPFLNHILPFSTKAFRLKKLKTIRTPQTYLAYMHTAYVFMVKSL